eukprot:CAMPEP_0168390976 /NCGR_PEP_ID=MMETSP0228-20121227/17749_1 /TAXON_ID=133427 /ORGANISM="Protoceratium reticulatum, Strain CCCM 535 (=CCMP 1889)" /LENGTH=553 /DNA_ID=CAMNT_0008404281 /DNA_START=62 /DNA_END=1720 /DNA_ORIENTATION=-
MAETLVGLGGGSSNANVAKIAIEQRKKKQDVVEPQVISEDLLTAGSIEPVRPDGEPWDPIDFPQVTSLRLSFQNIIEISNLNNFDSLTTLRLDNNIIDKIAHLNHLVQLTWLDLSFNNIREVEGLEDLRNLLDLSLYHNQIEEIKGLDGCPRLNILSLGHNNIRDLRQIDNLRKFQNLRCVCLDGNRVCQSDTYNQHVLAYLPTLKYLDYMLIDRKAVTQAQEGYAMDELLELKEREQAEAARERARKEKDVVVERLKGAFLDCSEDLFEDLFSRDAEPESLTVLQCYGQMKEEFRDKLADDVKALRSWMEEKNEARQRRAGAFERAVGLAERESEEEAFRLVRDFRSLKKRVLSRLDREEQRPEAEALAQELARQLGGLQNQLMANEIQLQESIEDAVSLFEAKIGDIVKVMSDKGREFFGRLEELEKGFFTGVMEGAISEMEAFAQNQDINTLTDSDTNKARFLGNREEMTAACGNFNEAHMVLIQNREDQMQNAMNHWRTSFFERHRERQYHRNRQRIRDTHNVIEEFRAEIAAAVDAGDDYDDHEAGNE